MWGLSLLLASGLGAPSWAVSPEQSAFEIIGVEANLKSVGVGERWTEASRTQCEARLIDRKSWEPTLRETLRANPDEPERAFGRRCMAFYAKFGKTHNLHTIDWAESAMAPMATSIKDDAGKLLSTSPLVQDYPEIQVHDFGLGANDPTWQVVVKSNAEPDAWRLYQHYWGVPEDEAPTYQIVIRPKLEPIAVLSLDGRYKNGEALVSPLKVLTNDHYGLVLVMFRQTWTSPDGMLLYRYRPLMMKWPEFELLSVEEAHKVLMTTSEYAMEPSEMATGPNVRHLAYRAFMRLLVEKPAVSDIQAALSQASPAGKLYWLALLSFVSPEAYAEAQAHVLAETPKGTTVIEMMGNDWKTVPFEHLVHAQAVSLGLDTP